jgi:hypothetical protein
LQHAAESLAALPHEAFGRHVEQANPVLSQSLDHRVSFSGRLRAVQKRRGDSVYTQAVDLIFHQGNQRRYDEGEAAPPRPAARDAAGARPQQIVGIGVIESLARQRLWRGWVLRARIDQGRRLEAQRFPASRRQDDDAVAPVEHRVHGVPLQRPEIGKPPDAVERVEQ